MSGARPLLPGPMHPSVRVIPFPGATLSLTPVAGNLCGTSTQPVASAQGGFKAWTTAKFPAAQVLFTAAPMLSSTDTMPAPSRAAALRIRLEELEDRLDGEPDALRRDERPAF